MAQSQTPFLQSAQALDQAGHSWQFGALRAVQYLYHGQHILSQAFIRCLNAQTKSFYLGKKLTTIDLSCKNLRKEQIYQVEDLSNQIIFENRPIRVKFVKSNQQTDFSLRKPSQRKGQLRIVEILDFDLSACGGTHCRQTGEVGIIKIRRWERVKQHARVEFYCGWRALRDYRRKNHSIYHLSKIYSSSDTQILENAQIQMARNQEIRKNYTTLENAFLETKSTLLLKKVKRIKGIKVVCEILEENALENISKIAQRITCMPGYVVLLAVTTKKPTLFFACSEDLSYDMSEWIKICAPCIGGRGGGHRTQAQGGGTQKNGLEQALQKALQQL